MAIIALPAFERFAFVMSVLEGYSDQEARFCSRCTAAKSSRRELVRCSRSGKSAELHRKLVALIDHGGSTSRL